MRHLPLHLDRHVIAAAEIRIEAGRKHVRQHADRISASVHPPHEAGVRIAGRERKHIAHELAVDGREIGATNRNRFTQTVTHGVRDRLPGRPFADVLDVIENIIEHLVPLGTQIRPI